MKATAAANVIGNEHPAAPAMLKPNCHFMPPESSQPTDFSIDPRHPAYGASVSKQFEVASGIYLRRMWWTDKQLRCTEAIRHVKYSTIYI